MVFNVACTRRVLSTLTHDPHFLVNALGQQMWVWRDECWRPLGRCGVSCDSSCWSCGEMQRLRDEHDDIIALDGRQCCMTV